MHAHTPQVDVTVPPGARFVASAPEGVYFSVSDHRWHRLPVPDRRWFASEEKARAAGYRPVPGPLEGLEEFELLGEIGRGATATVYRARDPILDRDVAIKVVHRTHQDDEETLARCFREARVVARLSHPSIVSVYSVRRLPSGGLALVMEYIPGRTLRELIRDEGALPLEQVDSILRDVGAALAAAHREGIVHRDVKPQNIFLHETSGRSLLADFGIAIPLSDAIRITHAGSVIGTPAYMSPEQFEGDAVDGRSDLYSLGLVAWEMLTGRSPWEGESLFNIVYKQKTVAVPSLRSVRQGVPARLRVAIDKALHKDPSERWNGVDEFLSCLEGNLPDLRSRLAALWPFAAASDEQPSPPPASIVVTASDTPTVQYPREQVPPEGWTAPRPRRAPARGQPRRWTRSAVVLMAIGIISAAGAGLHLQSRTVEPGSDPQVDDLAPPPTLVAPIQELARRTSLELPEAVGGDTAVLDVSNDVFSPVVDEAIEPDSAASTAAETSGEESSPTEVPEEPAPPPSTPTLAVDDRPSRIAAGGLHSCAIGVGGVVSCWGGNERGQTGHGSGPRQAVPLTLDIAAVPYAVTAGGFHSCMLDVTGTAYCWGDNGEGQLGAGSTLDAGPLRIPDVRFFSLAAGLSHTCGIGRDGRTYCWGSNAHGQLGDGSSENRRRPVRVRSPVSLVSVSTGWTHTCALGSNGRAYCWGENSRGQVGDGSTTNRSSPTPVAGEVRFRAISAGSSHTCALASEGAVYCWGENGDGRLGDGGTSDRPSPTKVQTDRSFTQVSAGGRHTCALTAEGAAYCWGQNGYGQLGDGGSASHTQPVAVNTELRFQTIRSGGSHTCGTTFDGSRYCWGFNIEGQLGDGTLAHRSLPAPVRSEDGDSG